MWVSSLRFDADEDNQDMGYVNDDFTVFGSDEHKKLRYRRYLAELRGQVTPGGLVRGRLRRFPLSKHRHGSCNGAEACVFARRVCMPAPTWREEGIENRRGENRNRRGKDRTRW